MTLPSLFFCFPGFLSGEVRMLFFLCLSPFYTPRDACEPAICESLRILLRVSFLDVLVSFTSLPDLIFFLSLPVLNVSFFLFRSCLFPSFCVVCGLLGFCGDLTRTCADPHFYVLSEV